MRVETQFNIKLLGELTISRGGDPLPLPPSKKTRALLGYLVATGKRHRRERLCELFWDMPDDPKGALRWSLSRLRKIVNADGSERIRADREHVWFEPAEVEIDLLSVRALAGDGPGALPPDRVEQTAALLGEELLEGLDHTGGDAYAAWLVAERDELSRLRDMLDAGQADPAMDEAPSCLEQDVRFCRSPDGVTLAYATVGSGPPLVKTANWMNHLEFDWDSPVWSHWLREFASDHFFVRYDERGNGLSDWKVDELSLEKYVEDLETVVDAVRLERFPLLGISQGCAVAVNYAVRHPDRVSHLVLFGGFASGWRHLRDSDQIEQYKALQVLIRQGWGRQNPVFRQTFTNLFFRSAATADVVDWFNELQRVTISPENAAQLWESFGDINVSELLSQVTVPTLVLHSRNDAMVPFALGRGLAADIPGARFVALESDNHLLLENEPAWPKFVTEVRRFLAGP